MTTSTTSPPNFMHFWDFFFTDSERTVKPLGMIYKFWNIPNCLFDSRSSHMVLFCTTVTELLSSLSHQFIRLMKHHRIPLDQHQYRQMIKVTRLQHFTGGCSACRAQLFEVPSYCTVGLTLISSINLKSNFLDNNFHMFWAKTRFHLFFLNPCSLLAKRFR